MRLFLQILWFIVVVYLIIVFFFPATAKSIDDYIWLDLSTKITGEADLTKKKLEDAKEWTMDWIDNPAPNNSKRIQDSKDALDSIK